MAPRASSRARSAAATSRRTAGSGVVRAEVAAVRDDVRELLGESVVKVAGKPTTLFEHGHLGETPVIGVHLADGADREADVGRSPEDVARVDPIGVQRRKEDVILTRGRTEDAGDRDPGDELIPARGRAAAESDRAEGVGNAGARLQSQQGQVSGRLRPGRAVSRGRIDSERQLVLEHEHDHRDDHQRHGENEPCEGGRSRGLFQRTGRCERRPGERYRAERAPDDRSPHRCLFGRAGRERGWNGQEEKVRGCQERQCRGEE